ncbi:hypothetical protein LWI29_006844 [Acer saccharum]|uniref:BAG family molecular chaperone regulator 4 n=1 Tax=Acer saccharum TaxID=4024 RepID=A0AA39VFD4_ACESA|nr:hypothetical protein LWI29_006844 [Acer saccharum]
MNVSNNSIEPIEWETRPSGMLVQRRDGDGDGDNHQVEDAAAAASSLVLNIKINVAHGPSTYEVHVPAFSTFGDVKKAIMEQLGLVLQQPKILFRGKEKEDSEHIHTSGVRENSKLLLLGELMSKEEQREEVPDSEEMRKALQAVAGVKTEIDKLSERMDVLEVAVNCGTKIVVEKFDVSTELLMRQLLKLDGIEAEGEAKMQRKAEVRRVQKFHEALNNLKARNSNPFNDSSNSVTVTTQWETFDFGMGSLNPPPSMPSSTNIKQDWERFD